VFNSKINIFIEGKVKPTPIPLIKKPKRHNSKEFMLKSNTPTAIAKQPIVVADKNLFCLPNRLVKNVPKIEPANCVGKKKASCLSSNENCLAKIGKACPIKTVVIPERKKAM
jgi:hypothetical protein